MRLKEYECLWEKALIRGKDCADQLGINGGDLELYQSFMETRNIQVLKNIFRRVDKFHNPNWQEWAQDYFSLFPPHDFDLSQSTYKFDRFLALKASNSQIPPFLVDLAKFEIFEHKVFLSSARNFRPTKSTLRLNKALFLEEFKYLIGEWVLEFERNKCKEESPPVMKDNILAFSRSTDDSRCVVTNVSPVDLILVELLKMSEMDKEALMERFWSVDDQLKSIDATTLSQRINFLISQHIIY